MLQQTLSYKTQSITRWKAQLASMLPLQSQECFKPV